MIEIFSASFETPRKGAAPQDDVPHRFPEP
jgi:hypothetical protein